MTTQHNHGANFGRKVEGCERCEELKAGAEPVRWYIRQQVSYAPHTCSAKCGPVCTADDW